MSGKVCVIPEAEVRCLADALAVMQELLKKGEYDKVVTLLKSWEGEVLYWLEGKRDTR